MKEIQILFNWIDLDEPSKRTIFSWTLPFLPHNFPFDKADRIFTKVNIEFILFLDAGMPSMRLSQKTRDKIEVLRMKGVIF